MTVYEQEDLDRSLRETSAAIHTLVTATSADIKMFTPPATTETNVTIQQVIQRIRDACQPPLLTWRQYRHLFKIIAKEIADKGLRGTLTVSNIMQQALEAELNTTRDHVLFVLNIVAAPDPWFERGVSTELFGSRFCNFILDASAHYGPI